jgi:CheY-like chemotaxis protein
VLVLTARSSMAEYFADKKIAGFLAKPCAPADLLTEVGQVLFMSSGGGPAVAGQKAPRRLVVADSDPRQLGLLNTEFSNAGFSVITAKAGPEALEACVKFTPDAVVMRLELDGMSADEVVAMLSRLPNTRGVKAVVYGMDLPEADLQHVANLNIPQRHMLKDLSVNLIIDRVMAIT